MNMLLDYIKKTLAASVTTVQQQVRTELVRKYDKSSGTYYTVQQVVQNHRRLKSRGHGGKQAHRFTGIAAARRAARKGR